MPAPSGNPHDYASQAPYWWPTPSGEYERYDGHFNPEAARYTAKTDRAKMFAASRLLSMAWFYTDNAQYAEHASRIINAWFMDKATRMTPHLEHAQIIPGVNTGRAIGIIDFAMGYPQVLDAVVLLEGAPGWDDVMMNGFKDWNAEFLSWLTDSTYGVDESAEKNNHGTYAAVHKAAIALFIGNTSMVRRELETIKRLVDEQFAADGSQPLELARTRSWHYSVFNIAAFVRGAAIGRKVGVDLWAYEGEQGQSLSKAVDFLVPTAKGGEWKHPELDLQISEAYEVLAAAAKAGHGGARDALKMMKQPARCLWDLYPAV